MSTWKTIGSVADVVSKGGNLLSTGIQLYVYRLLWGQRPLTTAEKIDIFAKTVFMTSVTTEIGMAAVYGSEDKKTTIASHVTNVSGSIRVCTEIIKDILNSDKKWSDIDVLCLLSGALINIAGEGYNAYLKNQLRTADLSEEKQQQIEKQIKDLKLIQSGALNLPPIFICLAKIINRRQRREATPAAAAGQLIDYDRELSTRLSAISQERLAEILEEEFQNSIPVEFYNDEVFELHRCPIGNTPIRDPVYLEQNDGSVVLYEKNNLIRYLSQHRNESIPQDDKPRRRMQDVQEAVHVKRMIDNRIQEICRNAQELVQRVRRVV